MGAKKIAEIHSERELIGEISRVISDITGVQLGEKQFALVQGRLAKRMRELKLSDPVEYGKYLNENEAVEIGVLISLLTTHHTFFFREFQHFEFLLKTTLPSVIASHRAKGLNTIRIWSAACSRGQEVYSLAMFLKHHLPKLAPEMKFEIFGSDVDEESVKIAKNGVYTWEELRVSPSVYLEGCWSRGSGEIAAFVRAKDEIRKHVNFGPINLMELGKNPFRAGGEPKFDVVFCRNVFIYFTPEQVKLISQEILKLLNPAGHFFIGLSESLNGLNLPVDWVGPSVYSPKGASKVVPLTTTSAGLNAKPPTANVSPQAYEPARTPTAPPVTEAAKTLRVLCVDDSPTVLLLLKRILTSGTGFEIVGTAADGIEAAEKVRTLKPDVITLDIHMPKMTGVQYLEKFQRDFNVPTVMVSSVPREDASLAYRCLELGASDYIEKPSAQNLEQIGEELKFKLRVAFDARGVRTQAQPLNLDTSFKRSPLILKPESKLRIVVANFAAREAVVEMMKQFRAPQPATLILIEGGGTVLDTWVSEASKKLSSARHELPKSGSEILSGMVYLQDFELGAKFLTREASSLRSLQISYLVVGPLGPGLVKQLNSISMPDLMLEDRGRETPPSLMSRARLVAPLTSFVYESDRYFAEGKPK